MSLQAIVILSGMAGGATWAAITLAATSWFNRRAQRLSEKRTAEVSAVFFEQPAAARGDAGRFVYIPMSKR